MDSTKSRGHGFARVASIAILAGLVTGCADQGSTPAPVFYKGDGSMSAGPGPMPMASAPIRPMPPATPMAGPGPTASAAPLVVTVRSGQTLNGYALTYHVPREAIIAANDLKPPYELKIGMSLRIPATGAPPVHQAMATPVPPLAPVTPPPMPSPPAHPASLTPPAAPPPPVAAKTPDVIPLDGPAPKQAAAAPPPVMPPRNPAAALPLPGEASPQLPAGPPVGAPPVADNGQSTVGGRFPWPVRGRILATYGSNTGGTHNDGINIAAARGTPVRAIDGGTVAYAGNEVKGYGNLVLIKHDNGWISAYAHLDALNVKAGDKITAGESFAKVGDTGGVSEPQLHFELRRGRKPVDPKEFLAPAPSASGAVGNTAG